jgi:Domain of unknown function (DUF4406)
MRVYISGPIDGKPDQNEVAFRQAEKVLKKFGYYTLVPHDIPAFQHRNGEDCPPGYSKGEGHSSACWIRGDLAAMLESCDAIYLIEGWEMSRGAVLEFQVATLCGFQIFYAGQPLPGVWKAGKGV